MPRRAKGPRLYLRENRKDARTGKPLPDVWVIRDRGHERSTGCPPDRLGDAERELAIYIASKWTPAAGEAIRNRRDPAQVGVTEVLALYAMERAPKLAADPKSTAGFIANLNAWWGDKMIADVRRSTCDAYVAHRTSQPNTRYKDPLTAPRIAPETASRELDTLSAAIGYWNGEDTLVSRPKVAKPLKPESPRDALTRPQAAALLKAAMGWRKTEDGWVRLGGSAIANRAHLRRFILIGLYTGTRHSAMRALLWEEALTQAWVDLDKGMIYRRGRGERETTKRRPVVKLPRRLLAHMRRWREMDLRDHIADVGKMVEPSHHIAQASKLMGRRSRHSHPITSVLHHGGEPISGKIRTGFEGCVRDAGLPEEVTPHWLRHTAATWLMQSGASLWEAAGYLGMSSTTLEKHYGHHQPGHQEGARRALR